MIYCRYFREKKICFLVKQWICEFSKKWHLKKEQSHDNTTLFQLIILTLLYDISKSVFDPLDGTNSIPHFARNYHLAAFQHGTIARPDPKILSLACNRKIKMISIRKLCFFGRISAFLHAIILWIVVLLARQDKAK